MVVTGLCALLCIAILVIGLLGAVAGARHRAQVAADLGALAAADVALGRRPGDPCALAAAVVSSNHARLAECAVDGNGRSLVQVAVHPPDAAAFLGEATAWARAGPAP